MAGASEHGLTVVILPLQSLMKDQVDNLEKDGIIDAVTVNGLLSPIEWAEALQRVETGMASMLYISPEQLRSATIERLLLSRTVTRFVVAWQGEGDDEECAVLLPDLYLKKSDVNDS